MAHDGAVGWIIVRHWDQFQHYKKRDPTWIKTYTRLLSDDDYLSLTWAQRGVLHGLWLEYAKSAGRLPRDTRKISQRLGQKVRKETLEALNHAGWIEFSASKPLALCYQDASPETETEEERTHPSGVLSSTTLSEPRRAPDAVAARNGTAPASAEKPPTQKRGEKPMPVDVMQACRNIIEGFGWDDDYTEEVMRDEFARCARSPRVTGVLEPPMLDLLIDEWMAERAKRYPTPVA